MCVIANVCRCLNLCRDKTFGETIAVKTIFTDGNSGEEMLLLQAQPALFNHLWNYAT